MNRKRSRTKRRNSIVFLVAAIVLVCLCLIGAAIGGHALHTYVDRLQEAPGESVILGGSTAQAGSPPTPSRPPIQSISSDTVEALAKLIVPVNDPYDLGCRLKNICDVPRALPAPRAVFKIGATQAFWLQNSDTTENFQVNTTLRYITPHAYFWLQDGIHAGDKDIAALMAAFEEKIYPTDRRFFGSEWSPGVDNDPHVYILYVRGVGATTGGYYSAPDEFNPLVRKYSNGHELFVFNADGESLTDEYTYGTLAHEFQHMIHWNLDRNEDTWMNEGFSELAAFLNGYTVGGVDATYARNPDLSLPDWTSLSENPAVTSAHYGESFLFLTYFLDRFGGQATQALVKDPENGLASVDDVLSTLKITDPQTHLPITADDVVLDWMATMYLGDASVGDGRYVYHNYVEAPRASATHVIRKCPGSPLDGSVNQYGAEYIDITCPGDHLLNFTGSTAARLLPAAPRSGKYAFWSNKGDESDMTLTHQFDFTQVSGPVEFSYWTWYDLEKGYDYLYVEASTDGLHWDILTTLSCTDKDLSGNSYGCAYTGKSGSGDSAVWVHESVDLSKYAGKTAQLRFEYVTDAALNGEGLLLDDLSIPAANYMTDFESGDGGWQAAGFARVENLLPQTYGLLLIVQGGNKTTVRPIALHADQTAAVPLALASGEHATLVVTGTERFTRLPAAYSIEVK